VEVVEVAVPAEQRVIVQTIKQADQVVQAAQMVQVQLERQVVAEVAVQAVQVEVAVPAEQRVIVQMIKQALVAVQAVQMV
jgi:uncharacterized protein (DUF427 family)